MCPLHVGSRHVTWSSVQLQGIPASFLRHRDSNRNTSTAFDDTDTDFDSVGHWTNIVIDNISIFSVGMLNSFFFLKFKLRPLKFELNSNFV